MPKRSRSQARTDKKAVKPMPVAKSVSEPATNSKFHEFYRDILSHSCRASDEWEAFIACIQTPLPVSFTVLGAVKDAAAFHKALQVRWANQPGAPSPVPWTHPQIFAWRFNVSADVLRKSDNLINTRTFINTADGAGVVSRQEEVSMLPPVLLQVKPHHSVLDMCASPGSKTAQIVPMLHQGFLIANDLTFDRCRVLSSRLARLQSENYAVANHPAQHFPLSLSGSGKQPGEELAFDRIICDVPCSGDGTVRKLPSSFISSWTPMNALRVHRLQLAILTRGLRLLAPGGRLVYSTCSLNPIENEAVVVAALERSKCSCFKFSSKAENGDAIRVVPAGGSLKKFRWCPGLKEWRVLDEDGSWHSSFATVPRERQPGEKKTSSSGKADKPKKTVNHENEEFEENHNLESSGLDSGDIWPSMFPSKDPVILKQMEHCMRIWPHHQNTGGFFITVFERSVKSESAPQTAQICSAGHLDPPAIILDKKARKKLRTRFPLAARYVPCPSGILDSLQKEFELVTSNWRTSLFVRYDQSKENCRRIQLLSPALSQVMNSDGGLLLQELGDDSSGRVVPTLNIVCAGLPSFDTSDSVYHLNQPATERWINALHERKKVRVSSDDLISLISLRSIPQDNFNWPVNASIGKQGRVVFVTRVEDIERDVGVICHLNGGWLTVIGTVFEQYRLLCRLDPTLAIETLCQISS